MSFREEDQISDYSMPEEPSVYTVKGSNFHCNLPDIPILGSFEELQIGGDESAPLYRWSTYGSKGEKEMPVNSHMLTLFGQSEDQGPAEYYRQAREAGDRILRNIYSEGYEEPSVVQTLAIPALVEGRDALIQSKSGTGKTNTFLAGLLMHLQVENPALQYIFVSCTHEVARQIYRVMEGYLPRGTQTALCIGRGKGGEERRGMREESLAEQIRKARKAQVICCTMGKLYDLYERGTIQTVDLKAICVDEFDTIIHGKSRDGNLSSGEQIANIVSNLDNYVQRVFISATTSRYSENRALAMFRPRSMGVQQPMVLLLPDRDLTLDGIRQYYTIEESSNYASTLCDTLSHVNFAQCIIFGERTDDVMDIYHYLVDGGFSLCTPFHGEMSGEERTSVYNKFKDSHYRIMIATDLASRGLDFQGVDLVINIDLPHKISTYIHRVGRSGRFGRKGTAISIVDDSQRGMIEEINRVSDKSKMLNMSEHAVVC